eukprot:2467566-Pyramimonas_sp.AAC.1
MSARQNTVLHKAIPRYVIIHLAEELQRDVRVCARPAHVARVHRDHVLDELVTAVGALGEEQLRGLRGRLLLVEPLPAGEHHRRPRGHVRHLSRTKPRVSIT